MHIMTLKSHSVSLRPGQNFLLPIIAMSNTILYTLTRALHGCLDSFRIFSGSEFIGEKVNTIMPVAYRCQPRNFF